MNHAVGIVHSSNKQEITVWLTELVEHGFIYFVISFRLGQAISGVLCDMSLVECLV